MTFADLYHLDKKCRNVEEAIAFKDPYIDEDGNVNLIMLATTYEDLKNVLRDCKALIYDVCQANVEDAVRKRG